MIWDRTNPYRTADVRGRVVDTETGGDARSHIDRMARKYTGSDYQNPIETERVILRIAPARQLVKT